MPEKNVSQFNRKFFDPEKRITFIGTGSLGGKAQSLADINNSLNESDDLNSFSNIQVNIPTLAVIRTDVFDAFMKNNNLYEIALSERPDDRISHAFQKAELPFAILGDLRALVNEVHSPLAVRSSSRLEDAMFEPFAGIYGTKMTPNNQHDADTRFKKLVEAIKFVYASTFFKAAKNYIKATKHKIEDEKMAVIIQEVVGQRHDDRYYPQLSGVARSYNFYPMSRANPEDGVVNLALGLGKTIVDGGLCWTYSPAYPTINPPFANVGDMLKQTQTNFWAVNMGKAPAYDPINETEYMNNENIIIADKDGALPFLASTVDKYSGRLAIGTGADGARILTFAPLLQLDDIPLNDCIKSLLNICEKAFENPVEIEFAMTFNDGKDADQKHRFGLLQVRHMVVSNDEIEISPDEFDKDSNLAASLKTLGNGLNESIQEIVYVRPEKFEAKYTQKIAYEIESINKKMVRENRDYVLIGFGRWGSSDPWLGIPVDWSQVSAAKTIVEATLENMNVELSQGSHFFHNLTSFGVTYFSVQFNGPHNIDWDWLNNQPAEEETDFVRHVKLDSPLQIKVDGRSGSGIINKP
ncbi:MAG: hypothetical protein D8M58_13720 [Calditrichaeota bacterium]|nr:MAG: hypothetical protein DWQ03_14960 [Calditrichota bacterium]MBL1206458.1 hypothetical protein [Calditrichota bacterium]NOG46285.1 hypothetical protein [Calditrichota bacterium]